MASPRAALARIAGAVLCLLSVLQGAAAISPRGGGEVMVRLGEVSGSQSEPVSREEELKLKIEFEERAEARALRNEGEAQKVLGKAAKSGSVKDYNEAQNTVQELSRETALQTLTGFGYTCKAPEDGPTAPAKLAATAYASAGAAPVVESPGEDLGLDADVLLQTALSPQEIVDRAALQNELSQAKEATQMTVEKLEEMTYKRDALVDDLKKTKRKVTTIQKSADDKLADREKAHGLEMQAQRETVEKYKDVYQQSSKRYADGKVKEAQQFHAAIQSRRAKATGEGAHALQKLTKARAKEALLSQQVQESGERVADIKVQLQQFGMQMQSYQGDAIFHANGEHAKFYADRVDSMKKEIENYQSSLKLAQSKEEELKADAKREKQEIGYLLGDVTEMDNIRDRDKEEEQEAEEAVKRQKKDSAELVATAYKPLVTENSKYQAIQNAKARAEEKERIVVEQEATEQALKEAAKTGRMSDLRKAEKAEAKLKLVEKGGATAVPGQDPTKPCREEYGTCNFQQRRCRANGAKCAGEQHGSAGGPGALECSLPEGMDCTDSISTRGVFVPVALPGVGFCAPWLPDNINNATYTGESAPSNGLAEAAAVGGRTYIKARKAVDKSGELKGNMFIVKLAGFHPDGAALDVGILAFKRTVCRGESCEEFKTSLCIKCNIDVYESGITAHSTMQENVNFIENCAMPMLKKNKQTIPDSNRCTGTDLIYAKRALMAF